LDRQRGVPAPWQLQESLALVEPRFRGALAGPTAGTIASAIIRQSPGRLAPARLIEQDSPPGQNLWYMHNGINALEVRSRQPCHSAEKSRDEREVITDRLPIRRSADGE